MMRIGRGRLLEGSGPFIPKLFKGRIPIFLSLNSGSCKIRCWPLDQCVTVKLSSKESYSISSLTTQVVHNLHLQFFSSTLDFYFIFKLKIIFFILKKIKVECFKIDLENILFFFFFFP